MATFDQILSGRNLTGVIQGVKSGLPIRLPNEFFNPTDTVSGHVFEWLEVDGNRQMANIVAYGSPAQRVGLRGMTPKSASMLHSFESQQYPVDQLLNLLSTDGVKQRLGEQYVADQTQEWKKRLVNLRQTCVQKMLTGFALYFDSKGQLLPNSSGAAISIAPSIPAGNLNQLDILGSGAIISASWATASTNIVLQIAKIKEQMLKNSGWEIKNAIYGKNIASYIAANDFAKPFFQYDVTKTSQFFASGQVPQGFQNLNWIYGGDLFYVDANGDVQTMLGDDEIAFFPDADRTWYRYGKGSFPVPMAAPGMAADAQAMLRSMEEVYGEFSYATGCISPPTVEQFVGDTFLPTIAAPKAVCKADVTP